MLTSLMSASSSALDHGPLADDAPLLALRRVGGGVSHRARWAEPLRAWDAANANVILRLARRRRGQLVHPLGVEALRLGVQAGVHRRGPVRRLRSARTASGAATRPPPPRPWRRSKGVRKKAKPAATPPTVWAQACLGWAHRVAHVDAERLFNLLASVRPDTAYTGPRSAGVSYRATSRLVSTGGHCTQTGH